MEIKSWIFSEGRGDNELMVTNNGDGLESLRKAESVSKLNYPVTMSFIKITI